MKRNLYAALAVCAIVVACHNAPKNSNPGGFTINGTVNGMDAGWIYFGHKDTMGFLQDSVQIKNHQFTFTGKVAEPTMYSMWLHEVGGMPADNFSFFVDDTVIQMQVDKDSLDKTVITGSPSQDHYMSYNESIKPIEVKMRMLDKVYNEKAHQNDKKAMDSLELVYGKLNDEELGLVKTFVRNNPNTIVSAWIVARRLYDFDVKSIGEMYGALSPAMQQTRYGKMIKKEYDVMARTAPGQMAPEFTMNDTTGKPVTLSSFHGKYLLLDFWASWCGPCRRENPNVVEAYKKYKNKNFTILGVSLDENKDAWEKAIDDDKLTWTHASDLKGWSNEAAAMYGVKAIPSNFLLDPTGKIIAHNLHGEMLQDTLSKILK